MTVLAAASASHSNAVLVTAALLGIATVVVLITWLKVHPFLSLILGSAVLGLVAGLGANATINSFTTGVGSTVGSVGLLIALGAMIGGLLADSGGADTVVTRTVERVPPRALPWAFAGVAALVGIPLFFEVGVVLLVPIVLLVARRAGVPVLQVGIPALAGLSVLHGFVPPHPGPLVAIAALKADLGLTLALGLVIAVPAVVVAGPLFATAVGRLVPDSGNRAGLLSGRAGGDFGSDSALRGTDLGDPATAAKPDRGSGGELSGSRRTGTAVATADPAAESRGGLADTTGKRPRRTPGVAPTIAVVLLPVVLMLARAVGELAFGKGNAVRSALDLIGTPVVALLAGTVAAMLVLGGGARMTRGQVSDALGASLGPIAGILLVVAAGGGFKQTLVDAGVGNVVADWAKGAHLSALLLGWLVAVGIRLATGSATVATITAAGIVAPLAAGLDRPHVALLVLAVGAGSLFFSHVNDAGFWLVKEYFGLTVGETIRSWSVMETLISVVGLLGVLLLGLVV